jgi:vacuolar protein sorting-associated protein 13A/C
LDASYESLDEDVDDAPITLTADEMKELEELAMKKANRSLTKDSMFCDVNFNLGSFQVNLFTATNRPLTSLEMGMVSASFKANADGSFTSDLSLLSLEVKDSVTPYTFYPTICRSLQKAHSNKSQAFQFQLRKSNGGDQEVGLKMVACEIVASPMLMMALKEFVKLPEAAIHKSSSSSGNLNSSGRANPLLYQSSTGDADLFYDATERMSATLLTPQPEMPKPHALTMAVGLNVAALRDEKVSDKLSSAIMDAWNGKNKQKQKWKIDFDISAPILILPENCTDSQATVLICNFGRFNFTYGTEALSPAVLEWFDSRRRVPRIDSEIDHLKLEMNDLSFTISSVSESSKNRLDEMNVDVSTSVIEPISFTLDVGLEHTISSGDTPRTCVIGVLPGIVLRLAPSHVTQILRVAAIWASNLGTLRGDFPESGGTTSLSGVEEEASDPDLEIMSSGSNISILDGEAPEMPTSRRPALLPSNKTMMESMLVSKQNSDVSNAAEFMHVSVSLLRLSINMYTDNGDGVEANLVSVVASSSLITDGTSSSRLSMGWFWVLDRLQSEQQLPRRQRLVCHSNLPRSAAEYAHKDQYAAIMKDLAGQGVFKPGYAGSADLADVNIMKLPQSKARAYHDQSEEFSRGYMQSITNIDRTTVVNAKFTSLFVNWNPNAIKTLFAAKSSVLDFKEKAYSTYERVLHQDHWPNIPDKHKEVPVAVIDSSEGHSLFILAEMESFEISLNSAVDDLPLFTLTMSGSRVNHHSLEGNDRNSEMSLVVGDFRMESCSYGRTLESYRTILGLAPSASTSLLSVKYSKGANAVRSCNVGDADKSKCEACAEIVLSPMRFVHIHSQVFTLIEYVCEVRLPSDLMSHFFPLTLSPLKTIHQGVFGAIAASVASSAAAAAMQAAKGSQDGERLFYIIASGFNFVLPQAAYSENFFSFFAGNFEAHYRSLKDGIGSEAQVSLKDVSMNCNQNMQMVAAPVNMSVRVSLKPPFAQLTEDERATRVIVSISRIRLLVAQGHYALSMYILEYNIGEQDNFLREEKGHRVVENERVNMLPGAAVNTIMKNLTHAGVENVEVIKR